MSFPLTVANRTLDDPPALARLVIDEAQAPTLFGESRPCEWLFDQDLEGNLIRALTAAMLQQPVAAAVSEGSRLAVALRDDQVTTLVLHALRGHDTLVLLQADPAVQGSSVEDALLEAAVELVDGSDAELRSFLLDRLRNASRPDLEVPLLAEHGSAEELALWLPGLLAEGLSEEHQAMFEARVAVGDAGANAISALWSQP